MKIYRCSVCGKIIVIVNDSKTPTICCGEVMKEIIPNVTDGSYEKHVPVISKEDNKIIVNVGSTNHPMLDNHYIEWILVETTKGHQIKYLKPGDEPKRVFYLCSCEEIVNVYCYCNLHGLWKASL